MREAFCYPWGYNVRFMEKNDRITLHKAEKSKPMEKAHLYQLLHHSCRERPSHFSMEIHCETTSLLGIRFINTESEIR
jgi:hypothetical protein